MRWISLFVFVAWSVLVASTASAQCRGSAGSTTGMTGTMATSLGSGTTGTGTTASALLTSPGSWYYDMMVAQAMQRRIAQQQYLLAMQRQADRQQQLGARRYRAEQQRAATLATRERNRQKLLAVNGLSTAGDSRYVAMDASGRR